MKEIKKLVMKEEELDVLFELRDYCDSYHCCETCPLHEACDGFNRDTTLSEILNSIVIRVDAERKEY